MHIFEEILKVLAQVDWQAHGLTGYNRGTPEPRLSTMLGEECNIAFWLWCHSTVGIRPMVLPKFTNSLPQNASSLGK